MSKFKKALAIVTVSLFALVAVADAQMYSWTGTLKQGSTGAGAMNLQKFLNLCADTQVSMAGAGSPGMETSTFGPATKAAVMKFQMKNGVFPQSGIWGPLSQAKAASLQATGNVCGGVSTGSTSGLPAGCTSTAGFSTINGQSCATGGSTSTVPGCLPGYMFSPTTGQSCSGGSTGGTPSTGGLSGTDGTINDVTVLSQYSNEDVGEDQSNVKVLGFEVEASNDGDIAIKNVKLSFDSTGNTGSDNLDDYIDGVSVWMGDTKVGEADVDEFSENGNVWSKTITLNNSAVVRADKTEKFYVSVDAASNLDSSDISGDSWTIDVDSVRYEDGSGVVSTDTDTGDINAMNVGIDFVSFSTAADTELKVSLASDSPDAGIVVIDDTDNTDDVPLLKGKLKLEGDSDVKLDEFPVTLTTVGGANVAAVTGSVTLKLGSEDFTESVTITGATTGTVTFDDLDFDISAGDTVDFEVLADINDIDAGNLDEGDTLTASVTSTNRDYIDAENEEGDQLSDSTEKSGTATGQAQEFRTSGVVLTLVSTNTSVTPGNSTNDDLGTFTIKFKLTAIGDTVYVSSLADAVTNSTTTTGKTSVQFDRAGTATSGGTSVTIVNKGTGSDTTTLNSAGLWTISEGNDQTFEITGTGQLPTFGSAGQYRMSLIGASWDTDSTDATPDNAYTSNLTEFKTSYTGLN